MKKLPLILFFSLIGMFSFAQSMQDDHRTIATTLNYYLKGGTNGDFETLKKAFHKDARMRYVKDGEFQDVNVLEFFGSRMKPGGKLANRETRIANIDLAGHAATARLEIVYPTFKFIDYMTLLKIDGNWLIVNKSFYREAIPAALPKE
ncbi:MAG: nuclear transport factor 2 family protein [Bacteroidota bacterium]